MKIVIHCDNAEERIRAWHLRVLWHLDNYIRGWQDVDIQFPPYEECGAYWAPSQGGCCIKPKDHDGEHLCP